MGSPITWAMSDYQACSKLSLCSLFMLKLIFLKKKVSDLILMPNVLNFLKPKPTETVTTDESGVRLVNWPQWLYLYLVLFFLPCLFSPLFFFSCTLHDCPTRKTYAVIWFVVNVPIKLCSGQTQCDPINKLENLEMHVKRKAFLQVPCASM